jgi:hypothetical protein
MPAIKNMLAVRKPTKLIELLRSSTKDIWIMTPAEKPKVNPTNLRLGLLTNSPKIAPIVVAIPARKDKNNAFKIVFSKSSSRFNSDK